MTTGIILVSSESEPFPSRHMTLPERPDYLLLFRGWHVAFCDIFNWCIHIFLMHLLSNVKAAITLLFIMYIL